MDEHHDMNMLPMIVISVIATLLSTMNIWVDNVGDMRFHLNDVYMALLMTSWMVLLDAAYKGRFIVAIIGLISVGVVIYLIRKQVFVNVCQFSKGMIPHHSMAIRMAKEIKTKTTDDDVIKLADNIINSQTEEIKLMKSWGY
jgi:hypothetical protein